MPTRPTKRTSRWTAMLVAILFAGGVGAGIDHATHHTTSVSNTFVTTTVVGNVSVVQRYTEDHGKPVANGPAIIDITSTPSTREPFRPSLNDECAALRTIVSTAEQHMTLAHYNEIDTYAWKVIGDCDQAQFDHETGKPGCQHALYGAIVNTGLASGDYTNLARVATVGSVLGYCGLFGQHLRGENDNSPVVTASEPERAFTAFDSATS